LQRYKISNKIPTDICDFAQSAKSLNLSLNSPKTGIFQSQYLHFWTKIFQQENFPTIFHQPKI